MAKVLLVEDDNNLREIYQARLAAEGYDISSASDGEEALVVAKQTKPDLVVSDVMMPKISGFEMLDILRNTPGLENVKVIMLTALGQTEDRSRADSLGADKYLVKSQVTLEDIVKTAQELLNNDELAATPAPDTSASDQAAPSPVVETPLEVAPPVTAPEPITTPEVASATEAQPASQPDTQEAAIQPPTEPVADAPIEAAPPVTAPEPVATPEAAPASPEQTPPSMTPPTSDDTTTAPPATTDESSSTASQPSTDVPLPQPLDTPATTPPATDDSRTATPPATGTDDTLAGSTAQEEELIQNQIENFVESQQTTSPETPSPEAQPESPQPAQEVTDPTASTEAGNAPTEPTGTPPAEPTATDEPAQPQPETAQSSNAEDDQLMVDAVNELAGGTAAAAPATPEVPEPSQLNPEPTTETSPETPASDTPPTGDDMTPTSKKIIQPLTGEAKPDINELLAREEAANGGGQAPGMVTPDNQASIANPAAPAHQPGESFSPQAQTDSENTSTQDNNQTSPSNPPKPNDGFDPNSVAL